MGNQEGYPDPTADRALYDIYHTNGRLDYNKFSSYDELIDYLINTKRNLNTRTKVEAYIRDNMPRESYYQKRIIDWIKNNIPKAIAWKEAAGPYSRQGIPDITCIVNGRYYGFEVKRPFIGKLSRIQEETIKKIKEAGGRAFVVSSEKEIEKILLPEINIKRRI